MKKALGTSIIALALMVVPATAGAAITVTTTVDEYPAGNPPDTAACSLREAISQANADGANFGGCAPAAHNDLILLPPGTYEIDQSGFGEDGNTTGDFDVAAAAASGSVTIVGTGPGPSIIDAVAEDRVLDTDAGAVLTIEGLTITTGDLNGEPGAGIRNRGQLTVRNSTVEHNGTVNSNGGGGIYSNGDALTIENSTLSDNLAFNADGSGLAVSGSGNTATLRNVTVALNRVTSGDGGGIDAGPDTIVTLANTIVAGNVELPSTPDDCEGGLASAGNNLIGNSAACPGFSPGGPLASDLVDVNPLLGPLASNGGRTQTHALLAGSPAIDRGTGCFDTDQRGIARVGPCDIGAYEFVPPAPTPAQPAAPPPASAKKCKKGFRLKKVKGKRKCVRKKRGKR